MNGLETLVVPAEVPKEWHKFFRGTYWFKRQKLHLSPEKAMEWSLRTMKIVLEEMPKEKV